MRKIIDLECYMPPDEQGNTRSLVGSEHRQGFGDPELLPELPGYGFDNYVHIFKNRNQKTADDTKKVVKGMSLDDFAAGLRKANVKRAVMMRAPNYDLAKLNATYPDQFLCFASISPLDGMRGVREFENLVRNHGLHGLRVASLFNSIPASDRRYYPLYAKCVELDVPVRIYVAMTYANDRSYELGHPRHLDPICIDFPELRVIAGLGGWPWCNEMVGLMRRHPNLYADTASHRPKHFATPGSGWEMFLQYGNTLLQDKIMIGFSRETFNVPYETLVAEYEELPLKDSVKDKWFYDNAARFFRID
jgi:predicted TIM-barrel fold metal-dependent hydrolase